MAGKPGLTPKQWEEVERRALAGESKRALGREFGVSDMAIRKHLSSHVTPIKNIASQLATVELELERLPFGSQVKVRNLADGLKKLSVNLLDGAISGSETMAIAHRLSATEAALIESRINMLRQCVDPDEQAELERQIGQSMAKSVQLTKLGNDASVAGLNLLNANRGNMPSDENDDGTIAEELAAAIKKARGERG